MVTQSQRGIVKPLERLSLHTSSVSHIPKSPFLALKDPNWCNAMYDEYNVLVKNGTWILVPRPTDANLVRQQLGVDFDETFSPVVKPATIRMVLSLVVSRQWHIHQLDVKYAFLNGDLSETRSLYGLKQAPHAWFQQFVGYAIRAGFSPSRCDSSLFIYTQGSHIVDSLHKEFDMTDLRALNYFLGISVVRHPTGLFLSQKKYALQLLERAHMVNWRLQYLTFTRPDLSYAVQQVCLYMHDTREPHFAALKRILRYVQGTLELGLHLYASAITSLVGYTDAD
ncbi:ribonuclease H-like domain-containing protein [Tanacetum coccineum]